MASTKHTIIYKCNLFKPKCIDVWLSELKTKHTRMATTEIAVCGNSRALVSGFQFCSKRLQCCWRVIQEQHKKLAVLHPGSRESLKPSQKIHGNNSTPLLTGVQQTIQICLSTFYHWTKMHGNNTKIYKHERMQMYTIFKARPMQIPIWINRSHNFLDFKRTPPIASSGGQAACLIALACLANMQCITDCSQLSSK